MITRAYDDVGNGTVANVTSPKNDFTESPCSGRHDIKFVFFSLLPVFTVVMNALVLAAVLRSYKRLVRRNHVYVHVISSLVANLVFGVLALIQVCFLFKIVLYKLFIFIKLTTFKLVVEAKFRRTNCLLS